MKRQKATFNELLRRYVKYARKLRRLHNEAINYRKQSILKKRLRHLHEQLLQLRQSISLKSKQLAGASLLVAAMSGYAQHETTFGSLQKGAFSLPQNDIGRTNNFSFVDLDGDQDSDMIVHEGNRTLMVYENTGTPEEPFFVRTGEALLNRAGSSSFLSSSFADIDNDDDLDMIYGDRQGNYNFVMNEGDSLTPDFSSIQQNAFGLMTVQYWSTPEFVDLDADDDYDILAGNLWGRLYYFENVGTATEPVYDSLGTNAFSLGNTSSSNNLDFADIDNDNDLDLMVLGNGNGFHFFENIGDAQNPEFAPVVYDPFSLKTERSTYPSVAFEDLDNDGDFDLMTGQAGGFRYFENIGTKDEPLFAPYKIGAFGLPDGVSNRSSVTLGDIDGDSDLDLLSGEYSGVLYYFENVGDIHQAAFDAAQALPFGLEETVAQNNLSLFYTFPQFYDIDDDGDIDILSGDYDGEFQYFQNVGTPETPDFEFIEENPFGLEDMGKRSNFDLADLDDDGDLDLLSGEYENGFVYFENTSGNREFDFADQELNPFNLEALSGYNSNVVFYDFDMDGDLDFISGNSSSIYYFENVGDKTRPDFAAPVQDPFGLESISDGNLTPDLGDLDGDGDPDLLFGSANGDFYYAENTSKIRAGLSPLNGATNVCANDTAYLVFDKYVELVQPGSIELYDLSDSTLVATVDAQTALGDDQKTLTLPLQNTDVNKQYAIVIADSMFIDHNDQYNTNMAELDFWTFTSGKFKQYLTFEAFPLKYTNDSDFEIDAMSSSELPLSFTSSNEQVASIIGNVVHIEGEGITLITATQERDDNFKSVSKSQQLEVKLVSATQQAFEHNEELELSPNPASEYIEVTIPQNEVNSWSVVDAKGEEHRLSEMQEHNLMRFQIGNLPSGFYILQIETKYGTQRTRFVKL